MSIEHNDHEGEYLANVRLAYQKGLIFPVPLGEYLGPPDDHAHFFKSNRIYGQLHPLVSIENCRPLPTAIKEILESVHTIDGLKITNYGAGFGAANSELHFAAPSVIQTSIAKTPVDPFRRVRPFEDSQRIAAEICDRHREQVRTLFTAPRQHIAMQILQELEIQKRSLSAFCTFAELMNILALEGASMFYPRSNPYMVQHIGLLHEVLQGDSAPPPPDIGLCDNGAIYYGLRECKSARLALKQIVKIDGLLHLRHSPLSYEITQILGLLPSGFKLGLHDTVGCTLIGPEHEFTHCSGDELPSFSTFLRRNKKRTLFPESETAELFSLGG